MMATAVSVGDGDSTPRKKFEFVAFYAVGSVIGGVLFGTVLMAFHEAMDGLLGPRDVVTLAVGMAMIAYSLESIGVIVPYPVLHNYVPRGWRNHMPHRILGTLYGVGLGIGVGTYTAGPLLYLLILCAAFLNTGGIIGIPIVGMGLFAIGRALPLIVVTPRLRTIEGLDHIQGLTSSSRPLILFVSQLTLVLLGALLLRAVLI